MSITLESIFNLFDEKIKNQDLKPKNTTMEEIEIRYTVVKQLGGGKSGASVYMLKKKQIKLIVF